MARRQLLVSQYPENVARFALEEYSRFSGPENRSNDPKRLLFVCISLAPWDNLWTPVKRAQEEWLTTKCTVRCSAARDLRRSSRDWSA